MNAKPKTVVVKIGGRPAEDPGITAALAQDLADLVSQGIKAVLVHGGGTAISALQALHGLEPRFIDGVRETAPEEMPVVDMALSGKMNADLVRLLRSKGLNTWGISGIDGGLIQAESRMGDPGVSRTGQVVQVNTAPLTLLLGEGYFPVVASPSSDEEGNGINVNADEAALALAGALKADRLIFLSDVPGVLENDAVLQELGPVQVEEKIIGGVIAGGMIPKVRSALGALDDGVGGVCIGSFASPGDLEALMNGKKGTLIRVSKG